MPFVNNSFIAPVSIEVSAYEWQRICVAITDNLLSWEDEYQDLIERIEQLAYDASEGESENVTCELDLYLELGKYLSALIEAYQPHLESWCERDGAGDIPILDYSEEFACICEAMQIYLCNVDYNQYLLSLERKDFQLRKKLKSNQ